MEHRRIARNPFIIKAFYLTRYKRVVLNLLRLGRVLRILVRVARFLHNAFHEFIYLQFVMFPLLHTFWKSKQSLSTVNYFHSVITVIFELV